jgi:hypothetical protein
VTKADLDRSSGDDWPMKQVTAWASGVAPGDEVAARKLLFIATIMSRGPSANASPPSDVLCPYCRKVLRWASLRWFGLGVFECERCGEFPDFHHAGHERTRSNELSSDTKAFARLAVDDQGD